MDSGFLKPATKIALPCFSLIFSAQNVLISSSFSSRISPDVQPARATHSGRLLDPRGSQEPLSQPRPGLLPCALSSHLIGHRPLTRDLGKPSSDRFQKTPRSRKPFSGHLQVSTPRPTRECASWVKELQLEFHRGFDEESLHFFEGAVAYLKPSHRLSCVCWGRGFQTL